MSKKREIIIFVKAPVPGNVKTRLVPPLSYDQAAELYRAWAKEAFKNAAGLQSAHVEVAYAAHPKIPTPDWLYNGQIPADYFMQSDGSLGERLIHAFTRAFTNGMERVVIIGSDSPGLPFKYFEDAFNHLNSKDIVLGPSQDGGYYLIGLSKSLRPEIFQNISWSTSLVFAQTLNAAAQIGLSTELLPEYFDIDTFHDLEKLRDRYERQPFQAETQPFIKTCLKEDSHDRNV